MPPETLVFGGHFPLVNYRHVTESLRVATIRHPVERAISHYCYWTSPLQHKSTGALRERVLSENLDIFSFAQLPFFNSFYRRVFFPSVEPSDFDLIIDQGSFFAGLARLSNMVGVVLSTKIENTLEEIHAPSAERQIGMLSDDEVCGRLGEILAAEIDFYKNVLTWPCSTVR